MAKVEVGTEGQTKKGPAKSPVPIEYYFKWIILSRELLSHSCCQLQYHR